MYATVRRVARFYARRTVVAVCGRPDHDGANRVCGGADAIIFSQVIRRPAAIRFFAIISSCNDEGDTVFVLKPVKRHAKIREGFIVDVALRSERKIPDFHFREFFNRIFEAGEELIFGSSILCQRHEINNSGGTRGETRVIVIEFSRMDDKAGDKTPMGVVLLGFRHVDFSGFSPRRQVRIVNRRAGIDNAD